MLSIKPVPPLKKVKNTEKSMFWLSTTIKLSVTCSGDSNVFIYPLVKLITLHQLLLKINKANQEKLKLRHVMILQRLPMIMSTLRPFLNSNQEKKVEKLISILSMIMDTNPMKTSMLTLLTSPLTLNYQMSIALAK